MQPLQRLRLAGFFTRRTSIAPPPLCRWLGVHAVVVPALLALAAWGLDVSGLDGRLAAFLFDSALNQFPARDWIGLDLLGHRLAKSAMYVLWLILLAAALTAPWVERLRPHRAVLWATVSAMALGPMLVVGLKSLNSIHCPWDLKQFGGSADMTHAWFVAATDAGRCFPGGHAAGGFSLAALYFAGCFLNHALLRRAGLVATVTAGTLFSAVRVLQGAHFLSHNLWAAAIDWASAALVFALLALHQRLQLTRCTPCN